MDFVIECIASYTVFIAGDSAYIFFTTRCKRWHAHLSWCTTGTSSNTLIEEAVESWVEVDIVSKGILNVPRTSVISCIDLTAV